MTPDAHPLIGRLHPLVNAYILAGFSGHGFMHGPIAGQLMAELVALGAARTMDIAPLALSRFASGKAHVEPLTFV